MRRHYFRDSYSLELATVNGSWEKDSAQCEEHLLVKTINEIGSFVNEWISHYLGHSRRGLVIP